MDLQNLNTDRAKSRRKSSIDISTMVYGMVPPQAKDIEEAVLGGILMQADAFDMVNDILKPEVFYLDAHQRIFKVMQTLQQQHRQIEILTVMEGLKSSEELEIIGGPHTLTKLTNKVVSAVGMETHARILLEKFYKRELIRIGGEAVQHGYDDGMDCFDAINEVEKGMSAITSGDIGKAYTDASTEFIARIMRIAELRKSERHVTGVYTGFQTLDTITHGWQPTDLIILAARPSVGKTAFCLNLARNAAKHPKFPVSVGFFSLEMSKGQLMDRLISAESEVNLEKITNGQMTDNDFAQVQEAGNQISRLKIFMDDTAALNVFQLRSKIRRMQRKHKVGLIIIDYLQLMSGMKDRDTKNREQEISTISRELKKLAKEIEVPIIALSQLSRDVEKRKGENGRPKLSDLRESGAIEQDADLVMFLYRNESEHNEMGESNKGEVLLNIAKHRNGSLGEIKLSAHMWCQRFSEAVFESSAAPKELGKGNWKPVAELFNKENDLEL